MSETAELARQQLEYWNGPTGERWAKLQARIDTMLGAITRALMAHAAAAPGERVLDIGCGCGTTTRAFAEAVGPAGHVTGLDISRPMLAVARAEAGTLPVRYVEADAATHAFAPEYDLVASRFGVMFFADPAAAFANIRKALAPGGRLSFVCWQSMKANEWARVPFEAAAHLLPPMAAVDPHAPGPFAFADRERVACILAGAGFSDVRIEPFATRVEMGATAGDAAREALNIGPVARAAAELDDATRLKVAAAIEERWKGFAGPQGVRPGAAVWLVGARG